MKFWTLLGMAVVLTVVCTGCQQGKFTAENFNRIEPGDDQAEVAKILGSPDEKLPGQWIYVHDLPYYKAQIHFENDRVAKKAWSDAPAKAPIECSRVPLTTN